MSLPDMFPQGVAAVDSRAILIESSPASLRVPNLLIVRCSVGTAVQRNRIGPEFKVTRLYIIQLELADVMRNEH